MNQIIEQIEKIKQINSNNNLVIFVGAGVSRNSGVCSWWELVKEIAEKIGENKCVSCEVKDLICGECGEQIELCSIDGYNCKLKYNFSAEDFYVYHSIFMKVLVIQRKKKSHIINF